MLVLTMFYLMKVYLHNSLVCITSFLFVVSLKNLLEIL
jgi:hypothetical protein